MSYITGNSSASGQSSITATFDVGTDIDIAALDVQNRVNVALPRLPDVVKRLGVTVVKRNPSTMAVLAFYSPHGTHDISFIDNYVNIYIVDALKRVKGVGDITAFGNYNLNFLNNQFSKLYSQSYPNSFAGITLSLPIFQGGKRLQQIKQAQFQVTQANNDIRSFENKVNTQYQQALSDYKSNLYNYYSLKENLSLANEVYDVIRLQYRSGVKAYLDVITAESDLRTAQINYYNALFQVLSSKIDVAQSLGKINY
jgi:hypothetical protein